MKTSPEQKPTPKQILGAKIRAAREKYEKDRRKPFGGGWEVPSNEETYKYLSKKFGMTPHELTFFFTYSRQCTHSWSAGACWMCPD